MFAANSFVTEDHLRRDDQIWDHHNTDITQARDLLLTVPQPTAEDIKRLGRPEAILTLDQLDNHGVLNVMGKTAQRLLEANRQPPTPRRHARRSATAVSYRAA